MAVKLLCEHNGLPDAGHKLLTLMTMLLVPVSGELLLYGFVLAVSWKQRPQPGPAPAPGPTPKRFCEAAALKPGLLYQPQAAVAVLQLPDPNESPAPYLCILVSITRGVRAVRTY